MVSTMKIFAAKIAVALLTVGVFTAFANAQSGQAITFSKDTQLMNVAADNTCSAGEPVALNGNVFVQYSTSTDSGTGANVFSIAISNDLNGLGQTTGSAFSANDSSDYTVSSQQPTTEATLELKTDLVSRGSAPNMVLLQTIHIVLDTTGNISVDIPQNATQCGT